MEFGNKGVVFFLHQTTSTALGLTMCAFENEKKKNTRLWDFDF